MNLRAYFECKSIQNGYVFLCMSQNKDEWRNGYTCAICAFEYNICRCILHKLHCGSCQLTWICVKLQQCWRSFPLGNSVFIFSLAPSHSKRFGWQKWTTPNAKRTQIAQLTELLKLFFFFFILCCIFMEIELFKQFNRSLWYSKIFQWTIWLFRWIILSVRARATRMLYSIEIDVTLKSDEWIGKKNEYINVTGKRHLFKLFTWWQQQKQQLLHNIYLSIKRYDIETC